MHEYSLYNKRKEKGTTKCLSKKARTSVPCELPLAMFNASSESETQAEQQL